MSWSTSLGWVVAGIAALVAGLYLFRRRKDLARGECESIEGRSKFFGREYLGSVGDAGIHTIVLFGFSIFPWLMTANLTSELLEAGPKDWSAVVRMSFVYLWMLGLSVVDCAVMAIWFDRLPWIDPKRAALAVREWKFVFLSLACFAIAFFAMGVGLRRILSL